LHVADCSDIRSIAGTKAALGVGGNVLLEQLPLMGVVSEGDLILVFKGLGRSGDRPDKDEGGGMEGCGASRAVLTRKGEVGRLEL